MIVIEFELLRNIFLSIILILSCIYQLILIISMFVGRKQIDFLSTIKSGNRISKSGIFFFILMILIVYQSLFLDQLTPGLVEIMGLIIAGEVGSRYVSNKKHIEMERIKKTNETIPPDEFKDL